MADARFGCGLEEVERWRACAGGGSDGGADRAAGHRLVLRADHLLSEHGRQPSEFCSCYSCAAGGELGLEVLVRESPKWVSASLQAWSPSQQAISPPKQPGAGHGIGATRWGTLAERTWVRSMPSETS